VLRVTTLFAGSAAATARYYTQYLTAAPGEEPGKWLGLQAASLNLSGDVNGEALELLLTGRDPTSGTALGNPLLDRYRADGSVVRAVAGFDATFSAPKSLSAWWALTGDDGLARCHDVAVGAVAEYLERFGATTRVRSGDGRLHVDTQGLTMAAFRQTTSRLDDPQLHTHLVISAKVQTETGRWLALDARLLKQHQRTLGGLYQSVLRAELTHRYGVGFGEVVNGQAEIVGVPTALIERFSKRAIEVEARLVDRVDEFFQREGRNPSRFEHAALERQAAEDTRRRKTGHPVDDLRSRWLREAAELGITPDTLRRSVGDAAKERVVAVAVPTAAVIEELSSKRSTWHRLDVLRVMTDRQRPIDGFSGRAWAAELDRAVDRVLVDCIDVDPIMVGAVRCSDGRSLLIEPTAAHVTSPEVIAQEEAVIAWVLDAQLDEPRPSPTVLRGDLDVVQHAAAQSVAGHDRLAVIVGPAGAGKTTMLRAAVDDLGGHRRDVFGLAPTAKAARVLERETGMQSDTVAKLLHEYTRPDGPSIEWTLRPDTRVVVDEAGMLSTADLFRLTQLATSQGWRLALIGDPHQLQSVARGGLFAEVCLTARTIELERIHRFTNRWEAAASQRLRHGDLAALDAYERHDRIIPGSYAEHLDFIAEQWLTRAERGESLAITSTTNEHVTAINHVIQDRRLDHGQLDRNTGVRVADGWVYVGDVVTTRRNDRTLRTADGDSVRNREYWAVVGTGVDGAFTVTRLDSEDTVTLPADYARQHVQLGYAATEHGNQSDTRHASLTLATPVTTGRGLYVSMTRGREENHVLVVTNSDDLTEARATLEAIVTHDRADVPAVTQRRALAQQVRPMQGVQRPAPPRPRYDVPDWFHQLRADLVTDYHIATRDVTAAADRRTELVGRVNSADVSWTAADQRCAPYDKRLADARGVVREAEAAHRSTQHSFNESGILGRRRARLDLDAATDDLTAAKRRLTIEEHDASRPLAERTAARQQRDTARGDLTSHDLEQRWNDPVGRVRSAEQTLDAFDTWRTWAAGHDIPAERLAVAVKELATCQIPEATVLIVPELEPVRPPFKELTIQRRGPDLGIGL
jgi:conjugative relaxase-like TrwC/TraI family protein